MPFAPQRTLSEQLLHHHEVGNPVEVLSHGLEEGGSSQDAHAEEESIVVQLLLGPLLSFHP
ncbi:MAG: hypothetical protein Q8O99_00230 [bacterium]|nr:hypothetical protein [bacterium]